MAELFGEVFDGDDLVLAILEPYDAAGDDGYADVLEHKAVEGELNGVEREILFCHIGKRLAQHTPPLAVVVVLEVGVGLVVEYDEALGLPVAAIVVIKHIEGAGELLLKVPFDAGVLAAIDLRFVENEVHTRRHLVHELKHSLFLRMERRKEGILGHILRLHGRADALRQACTQIAEALAISVCLGAKCFGAERVLPPLLNPMVGRLSIPFGIASRLPLLIERHTNEAMGDIRDGRERLAMQQIAVAVLEELEVREGGEDVAAGFGSYCRLVRKGEEAIGFQGGEWG